MFSVVAIGVFLTAMSASAAGKPSSSSISLVMIQAIGSTTTATATSGPRYGDQVSFAVTTDRTARPWVDTKCSQNGQTVYEQWAGFFDSYLGGQIFSLGPTQLWTGGAASCTATLVSFDKNGRPQQLASTSFNVAG
jgi:hypothetical protein